MITRREFVASASFIVAATASGEQTAADRPWYETMRRCGQLNLNERDPLTLDVASWIDYWASLKLDALLLNGGGIVAFYPTEGPYHHRTALLGSRDLLGSRAAADETRGLRPGART